MMKLDPLQDSISSVELLKHGNDDLAVVNAARCSFDKEKQQLGPEDAKLLKYLAKNGHWSPFAHVQLLRNFRTSYRDYIDYVDETQKFVFTRRVSWTRHDKIECVELGSLYSYVQAGLVDWSYCQLESSMRAFEEVSYARPFDDVVWTTPSPQVVDSWGIIRSSQIRSLVPATLRFTMPIFVDRQWSTHKQDFNHGVPAIGRNEVSRRYVDSEPKFYMPQSLRLRAENVKQGSSAESVETLHDGLPVQSLYNHQAVSQVSIYNSLIKDDNVAPELARMHLGLNHYTTFWETGTLAAWKRLCNLRLDPHAQYEVRVYAEAVDKLLTKAFKEVWTDEF